MKNREELWEEFKEAGFEEMGKQKFNTTYEVFVNTEKKYAELEALCVAHGLTLKEYQLLNCALDGKMTDAEIRDALFLAQEQLNEMVERLRARDLIGRRKGRLVASIEGRSAYYDVPRLAA
jgi:DNA-binding MarR family transcriptional regulator